jgi:hypothetical protein
MLDEQGVEASRFRAAFQAWNSPEAQGFADWISLGDRHWAKGPLVAHGEVSDVYAGARARWPTERVLLKVLRDPGHASEIDHERAVLDRLRSAAGAEAFADRIPQPVAGGTITNGTLTGSRVLICRWADGFAHTFEDVRRAYPRGIEPRASVWIWRRILEILAFLHGNGVAHAEVLPRHLLIQEGEHGVRLVGFRKAGREGTRAADIAMSARCVAGLLGGDEASGEVPAAVPGLLADEIARASRLRPDEPAEAWPLRQRLGTIADQVFGPPKFCPLKMPRRA